MAFYASPEPVQPRTYSDYGTFTPRSDSDTDRRVSGVAQGVKPVPTQGSGAIRNAEKLEDVKASWGAAWIFIIVGTILLPITLMVCLFDRGKVSPKENSFAHAAYKTGFYALLGPFSLLLKVTVGPFVWMHDKQKKKLEKLQNKLAEQQYNAMIPVAEKFNDSLIKGKIDPRPYLFAFQKAGRWKKGKEHELVEFAYLVLKVRSDVLTSKKDHAHLKELYKTIDKALEHPIYQELIEILKDPQVREHLRKTTGNESIPAVDFLQDLMTASLLEGKSGAEAYEEFGREVLGDLLGTDRERNCGELADIFLAGMQKMPWYYKQKSFDGIDPTISTPNKVKRLALKLHWVLSNFGKSYHALEGHAFPLTYNSYREDNQNVRLWDYSDKVRVAAAPGQTCGEGMRSALLPQRLRKGRVIYHNLQSPLIKGERERIADLLATREQVHQDPTRMTGFSLFTTPFDGKFFKDFDWTDVDDFFSKFRNHAYNSDYQNDSREGVPDFATVDAANMKKDNGYFIPPDVLTEDEVMEAFQTTQNLMNRLAGSEFWNQLDKARQSQMMQMATNTVIAVRVIQKAKESGEITPEEAEQWENEMSDRLEEEFVLVLQSCKQCIDRGPIMLLMTKIFFDISRGKRWDNASTARMMGLMAGRPMQTDLRVVIANRFQPFYDVLKVIGDQEHMVREALQTAH